MTLQSCNIAVHGASSGIADSVPADPPSDRWRREGKRIQPRAGGIEGVTNELGAGALHRRLILPPEPGHSADEEGRPEALPLMKLGSREWRCVLMDALLELHGILEASTDPQVRAKLMGVIEDLTALT